MTLRTYQKKRTLKSSHEPKGKKEISHGEFPVFCVQKHAASHLHYDFRLECRGVLVSWAIPKGVPTDPAEKHLAVHVEDHPLEYRHFEGVIPKGNYGAGTVEIWDEGIFTIRGLEHKKEIEKKFVQDFEKGHLEIIMYGHRLKGRYLLQRMKKDDDKNWLIIKGHDE